MTLTTTMSPRREAFMDGLRDGMPIALGYFVVSFTLGIAARNAGLTPFEGFLASLFNNASAGEYAAFTIIAADAPYLELAIMTLVANARYLLMSCVVSQKFSPDTNLSGTIVKVRLVEWTTVPAIRPVCIPFILTGMRLIRIQR